MKYNIVFKFIAIMLCALFLLTAAGSGFGILAFTELELYEKSVDQLYDEALTDLSDTFAGQIATRYAGKTLGGCPETILGGYGIFTEGYYGYILTDAYGNVLEALSVPEYAEEDAVRHYTIPVTGRKYMRLVETLKPWVEVYPIDPPNVAQDFVYSNLPADGVAVRNMEVAYWGSSLRQGYTCDGSLGTLYANGDGTVTFCARENHHFPAEDGDVAYIAFIGMDGEILYQASCITGVGSIYQSVGDYIYFTSTVTQDTITASQTATEGAVDYLYNAIPYEGVEVYSLDITYLDLGQTSFESHERNGVLGKLFTNGDGTVTFVSSEPNYFLSQQGTVSHISFFGEENETLYIADCPGGAGSVFETDGGYVNFVSWLELYDVPNAYEGTTPNTTAPVTEPETTIAVTEMPEEVPTEAPTATPTRITDNMDQLGVYVATITIYDEKGYSVSLQRNTAFGYLSRNNDGTVTFLSNQAMQLPENVDTSALNHIAFLDAQGRLLYEIQSPKGAGYFAQGDMDRLIFTSTVTPADVEAANAPTEEPTEAPTEAPTEVPTEAVAEKSNIIAEATEPTVYENVDDLFTIHYWDSELQENVEGRFVYEDLPEGYVMELWLLPGAFEMDPLYELLQFIWGYRHELFLILGVSVFLFAVFAVYLCCAAGRKPGREEVKPNGFNCIPLDAYLAGGGFGIYGLAILSFEGSYYLLRNSPHVIAPYILIAGYIAALVIVGFCFACAAQFKTPSGYWWKNLLFVRVMMLIASVMAWFEKALRLKIFPFLVRVLKFCWRNGIRLCKNLYRYTERFLTWLVGFAVRTAKVFWKYGSISAVACFKGFEKALVWLGKGLGKIAQRTHAWLHAFLSLLPVTWQWLLIGLALVFLLFFSILTRSEGFIIFSLLAGLALAVYGSHCFGILWDSTKNMSKGDLDTKVDDKLMLGCFKDFAADLNALADVAVVAAQKQLKSERMKTELITNVSHDIKTPLTSIINYVDLLQKPHTDEEQEIYLEVLSRQSQQMKKLLEDLIDMSKANTGNMAVYITAINAKETLSQALGEFADKLETAQLIPVIRQPEKDVSMQADGRLAWRVLSNILSNVVKYAMPGTRVYIDLAEDNGNVLISVKNISREALNVSADELMERFVRGDASRNTEGSGLGLNIARSLMEVQKGKLDLLVDGDLFKVTLTFPGANE